MNFSRVYAKCGLLLDHLSISQTCKFGTFCPAHILFLQFSWQFLRKLNLLWYELYKSQHRSDLVFEVVSHSGRVQFSWHGADPVCSPKNLPSILAVCFQLNNIAVDRQAVNSNQSRLTLTHYRCEDKSCLVRETSALWSNKGTCYSPQSCLMRVEPGTETFCQISSLTCDHKNRQINSWQE